MAELVLEAVVGLSIAFALVLLWGWVLGQLSAWSSPQRRLFRERRRHAEHTACAMRQMTEIRDRTARQMDEAERRWR